MNDELVHLGRRIEQTERLLVRLCSVDGNNHDSAEYESPRCFHEAFRSFLPLTHSRKQTSSTGHCSSHSRSYTLSMINDGNQIWKIIKYCVHLTVLLPGDHKFRLLCEITTHVLGVYQNSFRWTLTSTLKYQQKKPKPSLTNNLNSRSISCLSE